MKSVCVSSAFKKDLKLAAKRGKRPDKVEAIVELLILDKPLPARCRPPSSFG